ncbi:hypothetical protein ACHAWC_011422 [Mediolabrus comicus]
MNKGTRRSTRLAKKEKNDTVNDERRRSTRERREVKSVYTEAIAEEEERKRNAILNDNKRTSSTVPLRGAGKYEGAGSAGAGAAKKKKNESAAQKKMREGIERAEAILKEVELEIHEHYKELYGSAGMLERGGCNVGSFDDDDEMVGPNVPGASEMMIATDSKRTKRQIAQSEADAQRRRSLSDGRFGNWNDSPENRRIFATLLYKWQQENNIGGARWRAEHSHNIMTKMPKKALQLPHLITMGMDGELFEFVEVPEDWDEKKKGKFHDIMAQLFGYETIYKMTDHLKKEDGEMRGMDMERFIGDEVVTQRGMLAKTYKSAGYRFKFKDGNKLRFDMSQFSAVASAATGGDSDDS